MPGRLAERQGSRADWSRCAQTSPPVCPRWPLTESDFLSALPSQDGVFDCIFSVEYRLIRHTAFPGFLQDAASVYAHLVLDLAVPPARVVLIGDSAGGNVALGLCRWLRDAAPVISRSLGMPAGLLLLSPWCDPSNSFPFERAAHVPRPHADTVRFVSRWRS